MPPHAARDYAGLDPKEQMLHDPTRVNFRGGMAGCFIWQVCLPWDLPEKSDGLEWRRLPRGALMLALIWGRGPVDALFKGSEVRKCHTPVTWETSLLSVLLASN